MFRRSIACLLLLGATMLARPMAAQRSTSPTKNVLMIGRDDFQQLRWIVGRWRGEGETTKPFFEQYHFLNDSTLVMENFPDGKFKAATSRHTYELRDQRLIARGSTQWIADGLDTASVSFRSTSDPRNNFIWKRQSRDEWIAVLTSPPTLDRPATVITYHMKRVK